MEEQRRVIQIDAGLENLETIDYKRLVDLQGDFKTIAPAQLDMLMSSITREGFSFPFYVWYASNEDVLYVLDGHQRLQALAEMERNGWEIPHLPYVSITATSKKHAIEKLLLLNSRYGEINPATELLQMYDIDLNKLPVHIPEIDVEMPSISEITDFSTKVNFIISCEDEAELESVQSIIGTEGNAINASRFINKFNHA